MLKQEYLMGILLSATKLFDVNVKGIELVAALEDIAEEELLDKELLEEELLDDEELLGDESTSLLVELEAGIGLDD